MCGGRWRFHLGAHVRSLLGLWRNSRFVVNRLISQPENYAKAPIGCEHVHQDGTASVHRTVEELEEVPLQEHIRRHEKDTYKQVRDGGNMTQEHAYGDHKGDGSKSTADNHIDIDGITKYCSERQDVQRE